jgi:predicted dienelactone hydrolase
MRFTTFAVLRAVGKLLVVVTVCGLGWCQPPAAAQDGLRDLLRERIRQRLRGDQSSGDASKDSARTGLKDDKNVERLDIAGLKVSAWRPTEAGSRLPLVIFSHGFHGLSTQSTFLTAALAKNGYLVLAPNHKDAVGHGGGGDWRPEVGFMHPDQWNDKTYADRADDIRRLIQALHNEKPWSDIIDWSRFALAGHSLGGYTVLGLAGAWPSWKLPQVKAVLALSPYSNPFLPQHSLATLGVPVMYQGGTRDIGITPFIKRHGGAYDLTASPAYFVEFEKAGHFAWTDLVADHQANIEYYSLAFLNKYLKGDATADPTHKRPGVADLRSK